MSEKTFSCSEFVSAWERLDEGAPLPEHLAHHLQACGRCRGLAGSDPSRLFALLRGRTPEPVPAFEPIWERARLGAERLQRERRRLRGWAAAAACGVALAAAAWLLLADRLAPPRLWPGGAEAVADRSGGGAPAASGAAAVAAVSLPTLESVASPGARVVEFKIFGEREQVTEVILILDRGVDL